MEAQRSRVGLSYADIARRSGVNPGQVSRICRGSFRTRSANVVQICTVLGIANGEADQSSADRLRDAVLDIWDGSVEDAERLANLLAAVRMLRI